MSLLITAACSLLWLNRTDDCRLPNFTLSPALEKIIADGQPLGAFRGHGHGRCRSLHLVGVLIGLLGAFALALIAVERGEHVNALWIVVAIATYLITYRYYSLFIARRVMQLDPERETPAVRHKDWLDYVPTNRYVLSGHHFAPIAGAGPLVGPVLAAQMGYLPASCGFSPAW